MTGWFAGTSMIKVTANYLTKNPSVMSKVPGVILWFLGKNILLQVKGSVDGKKGIFEYIVKRNGTVSHQLVKVGGIINGKEN